MIYIYNMYIYMKYYQLKIHMFCCSQLHPLVLSNLRWENRWGWSHRSRALCPEPDHRTPVDEDTGGSPDFGQLHKDHQCGWFVWEGLFRMLHFLNPTFKSLFYGFLWFQSYRIPRCMVTFDTSDARGGLDMISKDDHLVISPKGKVERPWKR